MNDPPYSRLHSPNHNANGVEPEFYLISVYLINRLTILFSREDPAPCPSYKTIMGL